MPPGQSLSEKMRLNGLQEETDGCGLTINSSRLVIRIIVSGIRHEVIDFSKQLSISISQRSTACFQYKHAFISVGFLETVVFFVCLKINV